MARKQETEQIGEVQFRVTQEGFASGRAVFVRVARALGPALSALATNNLEAAAKHAVENLNDADLEFLADRLGASTQFSTDGGVRWPFLGKAEREELFAGNLYLFFQWLFFALRVNYADFFDALSARPAPAREGETPKP